MSRVTRFEDLEAWKGARGLTRRVYQLTLSGEFARDFGLKDQMRRAAVSIMSNIAEGFESRTNAIFIDLLGRAKGSAGELRSQLFVAMDAGYIDEACFTELEDLADKVSRQISNLGSYLRESGKTPRVREETPDYSP